MHHTKEGFYFSNQQQIYRVIELNN